MPDGRHGHDGVPGPVAAAVRDRHRSTPAFVRALATFGDRIALVDGDETCTYADLAARIDDQTDRLDDAPTAVPQAEGTGRRLVHVSGGNRLDTVVRYLAALHAGHAVLLTPDTAQGRATATRFGAGAAAALHPELALVMPTSGSTGAAKAVRLSGDGLDANARSIAVALGLTAHDRAVTSLPLHYCYGLSVVQSHLAVGASVVLTDDSVMDDRFWRTVREREVTTFAGVPHTFELIGRLERQGGDPLAVPSLRLVTQAGGRLPVAQVRHRAARAAALGHRFAVMYGQTEATARMTVLDPAEVAVAPHTVGRAVPGGSVTLRPHPAAPTGAGEIVYRGPNVMLGYADGPDDLALGRTRPRAPHR